MSTTFGRSEHGRTPVYLVTDRARARMNGVKALQYGNVQNAWRWFRRYDDLVLLAIAQGRIPRNCAKRCVA